MVHHQAEKIVEMAHYPSMHGTVLFPAINRSMTSTFEIYMFLEFQTKIRQGSILKSASTNRSASKTWSTGWYQFSISFQLQESDFRRKTIFWMPFCAAKTVQLKLRWWVSRTTRPKPSARCRLFFFSPVEKQTKKTYGFCRIRKTGVGIILKKEEFHQRKQQIDTVQFWSTPLNHPKSTQLLIKTIKSGVYSHRPW